MCRLAEGNEYHSVNIACPLGSYTRVYGVAVAVALLSLLRNVS